MFNNYTDLARRIAALEGEEVAVWPFFGLPVSVTKGPQRQLVLPDGSLLTIPMYEGQEPVLLDAGERPVGEIQEDGFLGSPELVGEG